LLYSPRPSSAPLAGSPASRRPGHIFLPSVWLGAFIAAVVADSVYLLLLICYFRFIRSFVSVFVFYFDFASLSYFFILRRSAFG
jgi:hypothetical protein